MKQIILCLTTIILLFAACTPNCNIKKPKGVKPIDWVNYNDVYTVFWNCVRDCKEPDNDKGREIKIYGWMFQGCHGETLNPSFFCVIDNEANIFANNSSVGTSIYVRVGGNNYEEMRALIDSLKSKFASADITKKCYIRGRLFLDQQPENYCCRTAPEIIINSVDDINFEEE